MAQLTWASTYILSSFSSRLLTHWFLNELRSYYNHAQIRREPVAISIFIFFTIFHPTKTHKKGKKILNISLISHYTNTKGRLCHRLARWGCLLSYENEKQYIINDMFVDVFNWKIGKSNSPGIISDLGDVYYLAKLKSQNSCLLLNTSKNKKAR